MLANWKGRRETTHLATVVDLSVIAPGGSLVYAVAFLRVLLLQRSLANTVLILPQDCPAEVESLIPSLNQLQATIKQVKMDHGWLSGLTRQIVVPYFALRTRAKVVYSPSEIAPILVPCKLVVLARNLKVWKRFSGGTKRDGARWLCRNLIGRLTLCRSSRIIAVSEALTGALPRSSLRRSMVIHHGCDLEQADVAGAGSAGCTVPLEIVCLGSVSPHKRYDVIVEAVSALRTMGVHANLRIWGPVSSKAAGALIRNKGLRLLGCDPLQGPVSPEGRREVLAAADVLAVGASFESFCLPLVEGMRAGCLVWAPRSALVEEICGSVAISYPEGDVVAAASALSGALESRQRRLECGVVRSQRFTWPGAIEETLAVLDEV